MKNILIVGAGGLGREVLGYLIDLEKNAKHAYRIKGFLDDNSASLERFNYSYPVVGSIADYVPLPNDLLVCALGMPATKAAVCASLKARGAQFMTLIHPTAVIGCNVTLGEGVVIAPHAVVNSDAVLGDFVLMNCTSVCGHDAQIGAYSTLSSFCDVTGGVQLGERVFMGSHATIIPQRQIGEGVTIGAGSVVVANLAADRRVFGVPARAFME